MTPRELLKLLSAEMAAAGVPDADVDAQLLLSHVTGQNPLNLRLDSWSQVSLADEEQFRALCEKRKTRTPLQYLTGVQSFLGRDFYVDERVLIPRPETELLAERAIAALRTQPSPAALDMCCGSGCLAVSMALGVPGADVHAADLSEDALAVTVINTERLRAKVILHQGDLFGSIPEGMQFDVIVSNPPYIKQSEAADMERNVTEWEPHTALFVPDDDALRFYRAIAEIGQTDALLPGGHIYVEINQALGAETVALFESYGYKEVTLRKDIYGNYRMIKCLK